MIAMLMEDMLLDLDCEVTATAGRLDAAIEAAETGAFDLAFLDLNLHGQPAYPVAVVLQRRSIPYAFVTGYGSVGLDPAHAGAPVLQKPFQSRDLVEIVRRLRAVPPPAAGT